MNELQFIPCDYSLFEPTLKLRLSYSSYPEALPNEGALRIDYDPEINAGRLGVPLSQEARERYLAIPALAPLADKLVPFVSESSKVLTDILCRWVRHEEAIRVEFRVDAYSLRLKQLILERQLPKDYRLSPVEVLEACIKGAAQLHVFQSADFNSPAFDSVSRIEIWVPKEVAEFLACDGNVKVRPRRPSLLSLAAEAFGFVRMPAGVEPRQQEAMELIASQKLVR